MYGRQRWCWRYQNLKRCVLRSGQTGNLEEDKHAKGMGKVGDARCKTIVGEPG